MPSFEILAVIVLIIMTCGDLIAGVVNDAVNFLNSAIGAKVSSRKIIMIVAAIGIIIGATFSDGIIEVARKGIFNPEFFSITEVIIIFTAVAITDLILLDLFSTFGLPTSTTVSVVFELLGGAHASFVSSDSKKWITENTQLILVYSFVIFSIISLVLIKARVNILKVIVLIGTGSLAMAFAGNDLANFIGVAVGGVYAYIHTKWEVRHENKEEKADFDLLRAGVNLMVAMGPALADGAWGKECAPSKVVGVMAVITGWFMTALMAFAMTGVVVAVIYFLKSAGLAVMVITSMVVVYKLAHLHGKRSQKV